MKLSTLKEHLGSVRAVNLVLPDGSFVQRHFHITEVGLVTKHFMDCGGTVRMEKAVNFQVWVAGDHEHRLAPDKLLRIIAQSAKLWGTEDPEVEVEYQSATIGKYALGFENENFLLLPKQTNCLAQDHCGIPQEKRTGSLSENIASQPCCTPGGGCC